MAVLVSMTTQWATLRFWLARRWQGSDVSRVFSWWSYWTCPELQLVYQMEPCDLRPARQWSEVRCRNRQGQWSHVFFFVFLFLPWLWQRPCFQTPLRSHQPGAPCRQCRTTDGAPLSPGRQVTSQVRQWHHSSVQVTTLRAVTSCCNDSTNHSSPIKLQAMSTSPL